MARHLNLIVLYYHFVFIIPSEVGGKPLEGFKHFGPICILKAEAFLFFHSFAYSVVDS